METTTKGRFLELDVVIENVADLCPKPSEETNIEKKVEENEDGSPPNEEKSQHLDLPQEWRTLKDHPIDQVIGDISKGVTTRSNLRNICNYLAFVSQIEPKTISEAIWQEVVETSSNNKNYRFTN